MKIVKSTLIILFIFFSSHSKAQSYFPPNNSTTWETMDPSALDWCQPKIDSLYDFLEAQDSKAFILLKDGKIVLEQYFNGHSATDNWYWASAGKTLTAFMVGMAQQDNYLNISDTSSSYLGQGWTNCTAAQEEKITIRHQLTMTTGLDDSQNSDCTDDTCLVYLADPGTRWSYHNAPYTLLDQVIENATGQTLNAYTNLKVKTPIGMDGYYIPVGYNNVYFSTARSMTRFGLLMLNEGTWDGTPILSDSTYFYDMTNTSQSLNESYGYLWWLNGKNTFMLPSLQFVFPGSLNNSAPEDMYSAMGKNGQFINVIPSENMVWIRMGNAPDNSLVPYILNEDIQKYINDLYCEDTSVGITNNEIESLNIYPNPSQEYIYINSTENLSSFTYQMIDLSGKIVQTGETKNEINISSLQKGVYFLKLQNGNLLKTHKVVKN